MNQHTLAPWVIADDGTIEAKHLGLVGYVSEVNEADRNLISAAPDLLAAVQALLKAPIDNSIESIMQRTAAFKAACDAIAKARGE